MNTGREEQTHCIIIGAGISGLVAAATLRSSGVQVKILDKSRGVGGRMATRRIDRFRFDHGAQRIRKDSDQFESILSIWIADELVRECSADSFLDLSKKSDSRLAYCSPGGMTNVPKHIAATLDIELRCRITEMSYEHAAWQLTSDEGRTYTANAVILTPPVPQTLALLKRSENTLDASEIEPLSGVIYEPCIAMMAAFDSPDFRFTGVTLPQDSPISLIVDNSVKGVSETPGALTVHAGSEFSQANYDSSDEVIENSLIGELEFIVRKPPIFTRIHRWRYSRVTKGIDKSHLLLNKPAPIGFAGDAFGTGDIEGAVLSGISVAEDLLRIIRD